jgi:hypothetical protein
MLYVCDHHFSIAYGRPPVIAESVQIREHELFLKSPLANHLDFRILSQVALFQILTRVQDTFESRRQSAQDSSTALVPEDSFPQMRKFNVEMDQWRVLWHARQGMSPSCATIVALPYQSLSRADLAQKSIRTLALFLQRVSSCMHTLLNSSSIR